VAKTSRSIELESAADPSEVACRDALRDLGWEVSEAHDGRLVATEDLARLRCIEGPIQLEVRMLPGPGDGTKILLEASMVGRGPIQSKHLREQIGALEGRIRRLARSVDD
jgi:hypothetical protein